MAKLTALQASRSGWPSRQTIYRKVRSGELSAEIENGRTLIDTSELVRVFGEPVSRVPVRETAQSDGVLQAQIDLLQAELTRLRADLEFERQRGERLMGLLETAQRQLSDQRPQRSWWSRVFGG